ncbi:MAG: hypothetical protein KGL58_04060 [Pseudomonadota bacterium]|nr:hypothetical protein [Pseudomonadota bacterium]
MFTKICLYFAFLCLFALTGCASTGYSNPSVTVPEIVAWSQAGIPPTEIIRRMEDSGNVYRLSASQLAGLHAEGVDNAVINYMQQTYLRQERLQGRFEGYGCCFSGFGMREGYYGNGLWLGY